MENRLFDHMLGFLSHPSSAAQPAGPRQDVDGLTGNEQIPLGPNVSGNPVTPTATTEEEFLPDPRHDFYSVALQIGAGGEMDGFIPSFRDQLLDSDDIRINGPLDDESRIIRFEPCNARADICLSRARVRRARPLLLLIPGRDAAEPDLHADGSDAGPDQRRDHERYRLPRGPDAVRATQPGTRVLGATTRATSASSAPSSRIEPTSRGSASCLSSSAARATIRCPRSRSSTRTSRRRHRSCQPRTTTPRPPCAAARS